VGIGNGPTPKITKSRFTYAELAAGATEIAILSSDGTTHISKKDFETIQAKMNEEFFEALEKNEFVPSVERWSYSSTVAVASFVCEKTRIGFELLLKGMGFRTRNLKDLLAERRPTKVLSGLVTGPTASLPEDKFPVMLKQQVGVHGINGRIEILATHVTKSNNRIVRIRADDVALERLGQLNNCLTFAMSGKVKFSEVQGSSTKMRVNPEKLLQQHKDLVEEQAVLAAKITESQKTIESLEQKTLAMEVVTVEDQETGDSPALKMFDDVAEQETESAVVIGAEEEADLLK
jgi:hypothetical protein